MDSWTYSPEQTTAFIDRWQQGQHPRRQRLLCANKFAGV